MSWHTNAVLIHSEFGKDLEQVFQAIGLEPIEIDCDVAFDEVASSSNDCIGVGFVDGWTVLFGGLSMYSIDSDSLAEISKKFEVFEMMLEGSSGTAGFSWYQNGEKVREYLIQAGEVIKDEGESLDIEQEAFRGGDSEEAILKLMTNLTVPYNKLDTTNFTLFDLE